MEVRVGKSTDHKNKHMLETLIDLYLLRCQVEGKSPNTMKAYTETLSRFARIAKEEGFPKDVRRITSAHIYTYLGRFTHYTLETRHRYFREVRCFFNWLVNAGHLQKNPFRSLHNVRLPQKIVRPFSAEEITRLLAACDPNRPVGARDRAILLVLLDTGIRCSELVQLDLDDLDLEAGRLRILHAKGNKQRVVPFASRCRDSLLHYLDLRCQEPGPLFLAANGHRTLRSGVGLQPNGLKQILIRLGRRTGIPKVHAHRFRHTFATWAIEADAREPDVQYLLGHSSPDMVRRYAATYNSEQAARRHASFSPADALPGALFDRDLGQGREHRHQASPDLGRHE